jgi:hypothetical protein
VRMADSEFDRVWYGHCPDEAPKPVASRPELVRDDAATREFAPRSAWCYWAAADLAR